MISIMSLVMNNNVFNKVRKWSGIMNKKYFIHFTWIVTLIMLIFTGLCLVDGVSIFVPFFTYITAMILYVLPMSFIGSKEAELVCIELENESGKIKQIEQIITQKMKREIIIDNVTEKKYCKKNKYDRWLTNDIILKIRKDKLYIYMYLKYTKDIFTIISKKSRNRGTIKG